MQPSTYQRHRARAAQVLAGGLGALALIASPSYAHPHQVSVAHQGDGQVIANAQNHGPFVDGISCGGDPAAYGLETAHHGPDAGAPGNADGCYQTTGAIPPSQDVTNPVIH